MDDAPLDALRLVIEAALSDARRELARCHDALQEARASVDQTAVTRDAVRAEHARWQESVRALAGHSLSGLELLDLRRRGQVLEARLDDTARRHDKAMDDRARAEQRWDDRRRAVGEQLARQRWLKDEMRRGREAHERQAAQREDED